MSRYLIFGATSGIGAAIADDVLERGDELIAVGRNQEALGRIATRGGHVEKCDLSYADERVELWRRLSAEPSEVDRVVFASGIALRGKPGEFEPDGLRQMFEVNTLTALELIDWSMRLNAGSVVTLFSSNLAQNPLPNTVGYSASKAAVEAAVRASATTLAEKKIRLNCIAPGPVDTPMLRGQFTDEEAGREGMAALADLAPLGRIGEVSDVVAALRYIESAAWLTGQVITLDGGFSCPA